jgi:UDP-glucose 4-epimerase
MTHILVTGAAGFIGSHTIDQLLRAGHTVTGVDNFRTGRRANLTEALTSPRFTLLELDIAPPGVLAATVARVRPDALIHLAALVSVQESMLNPALNYALNVQATHEVAEAARIHGVRRVVFASSAAVYGNNADLPLRESAGTHPISPYGAAKLASEALLLGHAAAFGLRQDPASPYSGVISIFDRRYRRGEPVTIYGDGRQTRDFVSVHDVARANVLAATKPDLASGIANICTGRATSLLELLAAFRREYPAVPAPSHADARAGDVLQSVGDPSAAADAFGFRAEVGVAQGLLELIRG